MRRLDVLDNLRRAGGLGDAAVLLPGRCTDVVGAVERGWSGTDNLLRHRTTRRELTKRDVLQVQKLLNGHIRALIGAVPLVGSHLLKHGRETLSKNGSGRIEAVVLVDHLGGERREVLLHVALAADVHKLVLDALIVLNPLQCESRCSWSEIGSGAVHVTSPSWTRD